MLCLFQSQNKWGTSWWREGGRERSFLVIVSKPKNSGKWSMRHKIIHWCSLVLTIQDFVRLIPCSVYFYLYVSHDSKYIRIFSCSRLWCSKCVYRTSLNPKTFEQILYSLLPNLRNFLLRYSTQSSVDINRVTLNFNRNEYHLCSLYLFLPFLTLNPRSYFFCLTFLRP